MARSHMYGRRGKKINKANHGTRPHGRRRWRLTKGQWR